MSSYSKIINFGPSTHSAVNNPLTYCLNQTIDSKFLHGSVGDLYGQNSKHCQIFMSDYCANKWDGYCEYASMNTNIQYPNTLQECDDPSEAVCQGLNAGEILIHNTAKKKYRTASTRQQKCEPFDPTVASSPMVCYDIASCGYTTGVDQYDILHPDSIDSDIVMNKILAKPQIAIGILVNIFNTMRRKNTLHTLSNTKLGNFFKSRHFQIYLRNHHPTKWNYQV